MEFKITMDKIARWNKMLLFWNEKRKDTPLAWFLLSIWPISLICGVLRCMSQLSIDGVKAGQSCFKRPGPRGCFLAEIQIPCSIFPSNTKKDGPFIPFYRRLEKTFLLSVPFRTILASPLELSTFVRTL